MLSARMMFSANMLLFAIMLLSARIMSSVSMLSFAVFCSYYFVSEFVCLQVGIFLLALIL